MPSKIDLFRDHKEEYATPRKPEIVRTKPASYLTIEGTGEPGGPAFESKMQALYGMAFTVKMSKKAAGKDYAVSKLEGQWWTDDYSNSFMEQPRQTWHWKLMIRVPDFIAEADLAAAVKALERKGRADGAAQVRLEHIDEGGCVQMLHVGPYSAEGPSIEAMDKLRIEKGLDRAGMHHEIYLSDPRRVPPEKLRSILRQPVH